MNILLINHYAGTHQHGMEYRPYYLSREWIKLGHQVTVAGASFSHVRTVQPVLNKSYSIEDVDGIRYVWLKTPKYSGNGIKRAINIFSFVSQIYTHQKILFNAGRPDLVIASSTYPLDILPASRLSSKAGAKLIFEVHDLWPLSPIELGGMSPNHPYIKLLQYAEDFAYRRSDRVVSMLPAAESYMRQHGLKEGKFIHIPNGVDVKEWQNELGPLPKVHAEALDRICKEGLFSVCYAGAHGLANALHAFIDSAQLLKDEKVIFVLVGQGPEKEALFRTVKTRGQNNVLLLPPVPKASIPTLLFSMDALYIGLKSEPLFRFGVSPNKLLDYMISSRPVIHAIQAGNDMVQESGCGFSVTPENPTEIAEVVKKLMNMTPEERQAMGNRGKIYVLENHDYRILAEKFLGAI